jgi:hypothetical protein
MTNKISVSPLFTDSALIWSHLKDHGGIDTKSYDADLEQDLRSHLSLPTEGALNDLLRSVPVPVESFLFAFFRAIQPYAQMMSDLLRMFEKAGATQTNNNLAVRFDFGKESPELSFDLTHFRQWNEVWSKVAGAFQANMWDYETIWALNGAVRTNTRQVMDPTAQRWITQYYEMKVWPDIALQSPGFGVSELDAAIQRAWRVWATVVSESMRVSRKREELHEYIRYRDGDRHGDQDRPASIQAWPIDFLARIDHDGWAGSFAAGVYAHNERICRLSVDQRKTQAQELESALNRVFERVPHELVQGEELVRSLEDFLQLPIWQRRHELYSSWVGSQILDACDDYGVRIHHVKGSLLISFSGTHLATLRRADPPMYLWAELRSPLHDPIGKGRKQSIQPDYSVVGEPITSAEMSVLVVECKQYKKMSKKNFCDALTDYANGRPNANVVLVNYGRADDGILNGVHPAVRDRTRIIGEMRPGSDIAQALFKDAVGTTLAAHCRRLDSEDADGIRFRTDMPMKITLSWRTTPRDLDLYTRVLTDQRDLQVYFSERGSSLQSPWVQLDADIRGGQGPETVTIGKWTEGAAYFVSVYNYSGESALAACGASVVLTQGTMTRRFDCPVVGSGRWWSILQLRTNSRQIEVINMIADAPW